MATASVLAAATVSSLAVLFWIPRPWFPAPGALLASVGAGFFEGAYFFTLAVALSKAPMGRTYAIARGGATLLVWPISLLFFGESLSGTAAAGSALVIVGLAATAESRDARGNFFWPWACALCIAGYHLAYKRALASHGAPPAVFATALAIALPMNLAVLGPARRAVFSRWRQRAVALTIAGVICTSSFLLFLAALRGAGAGAVLTLRNTSVLFAYGFAWSLGERPPRRALVGAGFIVAGAVLLGWPR